MLMVEFETLLKQNGIEPSAENLHQLADFFAQYKKIVLDAAERAQASADSILPIVAKAQSYAERSEAAQVAAQKSAEKLQIVDEHYPAFLRALEESSKLFSSLDDVHLGVLNTAATAQRSITKENLADYWRWISDGVERINKLSDASLLTRRQNEAAIWAYDDEIRVKNMLIRSYVEKPYLLFIVAGQSNAVGTGPYPGYEDASYCGLYWDWKDQKAKSLKPLKDPVYRSTRSSAWPAFGRKIFEITGRKVIILNVAWGGAAVTNINPSNSWYQDSAVTSLRRVDATREWNALLAEMKAKNIEYELGGMLWIQGEAEAGRLAQGLMKPSEYIAGTLDVFKFFRTLTASQNLPVYLGQIGYSKNALGNPTGYDLVRQAQSEICIANENVFMASQLPITYIKAGYMADTIHYDRRGYNSLGASFARFITNHQSF